MSGELSAKLNAVSTVRGLREENARLRQALQELREENERLRLRRFPDPPYTLEPRP